MRSLLLIALGLSLARVSLLVLLGPAIVLVGIAQYHLSVAIHEASHFGLFRQRRVNELAAAVLGLTIGFGLKPYRAYHWNHHWLYGTESDPDYRLYAGRYATAWAMVSDMAGKFTFLGLARRVLPFLLDRAGRRRGGPSQPTSPYADPPLFILTQVVMAAGFAWAFDWWAYALYWLAPLLIFPGLLNGLRMYGEHGGLTDGSRLQIYRARTTMCAQPFWRKPLPALERFVLAPFNFNLHHEHHLFPQIPYHALPQLHRDLRRGGYYEANPDVLSETYLSTFKNGLSEGRREASTQAAVHG